MPTDTTAEPAFTIVLTAEQTLNLGRFSIIWGQIDHLVLCCVTELLARDLVAGIAMLGDTTTGPLVNLLNKSRHRIADEEIRGETKAFCEAMGPLIKKRNHIMHGAWGFYLPGKNLKKARPASYYAKNTDHPVYPDELLNLANQAAEQTHNIARILHYLTGVEYTKRTRNFIFGKHEPRLPEGYELTQFARPPQDRQR